MSKITVVKFSNNDCELDRIEINDEDATTQAIAQAVLDMVTGHMSMRTGDKIEVFEMDT